MTTLANWILLLVLVTTTTTTTVTGLLGSADLPPRHAWSNEVVPTCSRTEAVCEVDLVLAEVLTMTWLPDDAARRRLPVVIDDDQLYYKSDILGCVEKQPISTEDVLRYVPTADGSYQFILGINNSLPGPTVTVFLGQKVAVTFHNKLSSQAITMHFHGQHQRGTPWMDGTGGISQCAIEPGESFTYRFSAEQAGTYFYHSHKGIGRAYGLAGAFIVLPTDWKLANEETEDESGPALEEREPVYSKEFVMVVSDWHNITAANFVYLHHEGLNGFGGFYNRKDGCTDYQSVDGAGTERYPPQSVLINGKGWEYGNTYTGVVNVVPLNPALPLERFVVSRNQHYRFRIINSGLTHNLRVSIDNHPLTVIASDGADILRVEVESVFLTPGERYDIEVIANDPLNVGNYWIRVESAEAMTVNGEMIQATHAEAILHYTNQPLVQPSTHPVECTDTNECVILNCPFRLYPSEDHKRCLHLEELSSPEAEFISQEEAPFDEYILNMNTVGTSINGRAFIYPKAPPQIYPPFDPVDEPCDPEECRESGENDICKCTHTIKIPLGHVVQLTFASLNIVNHPVHIHGTSLQVLKQGWGDYNWTSGKVLSDSQAIECLDASCPEVRWADSSWNNGNVPGVYRAKPLLKDTVMVPKGGYVVTRFRATNPGFWILHCHYESHSHGGMAMIIQVGEPHEMPPLPLIGFKTCGIPQDRPIDWNLGVNTAKIRLEDAIQTNTIFLVVLCVLGLAVIILAILLYMQRKSKASVSLLENTATPKNYNSFQNESI